MAYDPDLTERFRQALEGLEGITEKPMMGSVCFFLNGHMLGSAGRRKTGERQFMFRVGKDNLDEALARPGAAIADLGGRRMSGFIHVDPESCDRDGLKAWIALASTFVDQLPPK